MDISSFSRPREDVIGEWVIGKAIPEAIDGCRIENLYGLCVHGYPSWPLFLGYLQKSLHDVYPEMEIINNASVDDGMHDMARDDIFDELFAFSKISLEECRQMGFDDGSEEAHVRFEDGIETDSLLSGSHDWLAGILSFSGRAGLCSILGEPFKENQYEWSAIMSDKIREYCAAAQEGAEHVLKVIHGNRTAGS